VFFICQRPETSLHLLTLALQNHNLLFLKQHHKTHTSTPSMSKRRSCSRHILIWVIDGHTCHTDPLKPTNVKFQKLNSKQCQKSWPNRPLGFNPSKIKIRSLLPLPIRGSQMQILGLKDISPEGDLIMQY
jgi:hypothetical protein